MGFIDVPEVCSETVVVHREQIDSLRGDGSVHFDKFGNGLGGNLPEILFDLTKPNKQLCT